MGIQSASEASLSVINCKCGAGPFPDREAWMVHVREGMPPTPRRRRPDFRKQEEEQAAMMNYIAAHGILAATGILPEEIESNQEGVN